MTKEETLAIRRKLFEAFDSVYEALDAGNNGSCSSYEKDPFEDMNNKLKALEAGNNSSCGSCEKKDSDPGGKELFKSNVIWTSKKSCSGCAFLGAKKHWEKPCNSCRRNCRAFCENACDGYCDLGQAMRCHERGCVKHCEDKWKGSLSDET